MKNKLKIIFKNIKNLFKDRVEVEVIKETIYKIDFEAKSPDFSRKVLFYDKTQAEHFYYFLCRKYTLALKEGNKVEADAMYKLIQDFIVLGEGMGFTELSKLYSVK